MKYREAKKLHKDDEVTHRETKRICQVLSIRVTPKIIEVELLHPTEGWMVVGHTEIL